MLQDDHHYEDAPPLSDPAPPARDTLSVFVFLPPLPPGAVLHPSSHHVCLLHPLLGLCVVYSNFCQNFESELTRSLPFSDNREHLNSDMRDKELSYWTCRGVQTAGFFVATIDDEVVGTVSYLRQVGSYKCYL